MDVKTSSRSHGDDRRSTIGLSRPAGSCWFVETTTLDTTLILLLLPTVLALVPVTMIVAVHSSGAHNNTIVRSEFYVSVPHKRVFMAVVAGFWAILTTTGSTRRWITRLRGSSLLIHRCQGKPCCANMWVDGMLPCLALACNSTSPKLSWMGREC